MRILLVEDEKSIQQIVSMNLELESYEVVATALGKEALQLYKAQHFDLIILDVMLPDIGGLEVCEAIRLQNKQIPIIIVSAKDTSSDRIKGLKFGADDYLVKPFNLEELLLRIEKLLQRSSAPESPKVERFEFGNNWVNLNTFEAHGVHGSFLLTKREALLMSLFIERKNEVLSRQQILQSVWGYDVYPSTRTVDNFILSLRKQFEEDLRNTKYFHSIRGIGYKFVSN